MADRNDLQLRSSGLRGASLHAQYAIEPRATSFDPAGARAYTLLTDLSAIGWIRCEEPKNQLLLKQLSPTEEAAAREVDFAPRPLFQLKLGSWELPVLLSSAGPR